LLLKSSLDQLIILSEWMGWFRASMDGKLLSKLKIGLIFAQIDVMTPV
jgi:hypothetical protein